MRDQMASEKSHQTGYPCHNHSNAPRSVWRVNRPSIKVVYLSDTVLYSRPRWLPCESPQPMTNSTLSLVSAADAFVAGDARPGSLRKAVSLRARQRTERRDLSGGEILQSHSFTSISALETGPLMPNWFTVLASSRFDPAWTGHTKLSSDGFHSQPSNRTS